MTPEQQDAIPVSLSLLRREINRLRSEVKVARELARNAKSSESKSWENQKALSNERAARFLANLIPEEQR